MQMHLRSVTIFMLSALLLFSALCAQAAMEFNSWNISLCVTTCADKSVTMHNALWICLLETSDTEFNPTNQMLVFRMEAAVPVPGFLHTFIHYQSPASGQPLFPPQGVKTCHLSLIMQFVCQWTHSRFSEGSTTPQLLQPITWHGPINTYQWR